MNREQRFVINSLIQNEIETYKDSVNSPLSSEAEKENSRKNVKYLEELTTEINKIEVQ